MVFKIKRRFSEFSSNISWIHFGFVAIFSISSWICSTSIWTELSIIVYKAEEGWRLPSILTVVAQLGQIIPALVYPLVKYRHPTAFRNRTVIIVKLVAETSLLLVLMLVWNRTIQIGHERRSLGLYVVNFFFSLFDGISAVTYLAFIQEHLSNEYVIANFVGESSSSLLASSVAFLQDIKDETMCQHYSQNETMNPLDGLYRSFKSPSSRFSVETYFTVILGFMLLSSFAFLLLNNSLKSKNNRAETVELEHTSFIVKVQSESKCPESSPAQDEQQANVEKIILLSANFLMCFLMFGVLLGLQSYSTLSYGHDAFHMSINLGNLLLPLVIFASIWSYNISLTRFLAELVIGLAFSAYIVLVSVYSPCPPFINRSFGPYVVVAAWILAECVFTRLRCVLAGKLERYKSERLLILMGSVSLFGQIAGGLLIYLLVDVYRLFVAKPECGFDKTTYCMTPS